MTRNLKLFIGAGIVFYIIGAVNESVAMYVLAAASLAVILSCFFLTRLQIRGVEATIDLHVSRARAGGTVEGTISVRNAGAIRRTGMSLAVRVENETVPEGTREYEFILPALAPSSRTEMDVAFECLSRGRHRVSDVRVIANDPIGMYHRWKRFDSPASFLGLPHVHSAPGPATWELLSPGGRRTARMLRRSGGDFQGIRPHTTGDDLRMVHWKVTAHAGELVVKQFRRRRDAEVTIWLDLWQGNHPTSGPDSPLEVSISLAATLLDIFVRGDYLLSVAGQGLSADLGMPSRGEGYLDRALVSMAESRACGGLGFAQFCSERARVSPGLKNVFAISAAAEPPLLDTLTGMRQRGAHVVAFLTGGLEETEGDETARRLLAAAQEETVQALRATGITAMRVPSIHHVPAVFSEIAVSASAEVTAS